MSFSALAPLWDVVGPPLRPSAEDLQIYAQHAQGHVLVLGATRELLALSDGALGVDLCPEMVERAGGHAVLGDWRQLPIEDSSMDNVLGDGSLSAIGDEEMRRQVLAEVRRVLRPGGRLVLRSYVRTEQRDIPVTSINGMKLRLWGCVAEPAGQVVLGDVWRAWCELPDATRSAFSPEAIATIEAYRNSTDSYWVPTRMALTGFLEDCGFRIKDAYVPRSYELSERCPLLILESLDSEYGGSEETP